MRALSRREKTGLGTAAALFVAGIGVHEVRQDDTEIVRANTPELSVPATEEAVNGGATGKAPKAPIFQKDAETNPANVDEEISISETMESMIKDLRAELEKNYTVYERGGFLRVDWPKTMRSFFPIKIIPHVYTGTVGFCWNHIRFKLTAEDPIDSERLVYFVDGLEPHEVQLAIGEIIAWLQRQEVDEGKLFSDFKTGVYDGNLAEFEAKAAETRNYYKGKILEDLLEINGSATFKESNSYGDVWAQDR